VFELVILCLLALTIGGIILQNAVMIIVGVTLGLLFAAIIYWAVNSPDEASKTKAVAGEQPLYIAIQNRMAEEQRLAEESVRRAQAEIHKSIVLPKPRYPSRIIPPSSRRILSGSSGRFSRENQLFGSTSENTAKKPTEPSEEAKHIVSQKESPIHYPGTRTPVNQPNYPPNYNRYPGPTPRPGGNRPPGYGGPPGPPGR